jgi:hypothetical protein
MLRALLKEPLVHFLVLGLIIFVVYHALNRSNEQEPDKIVVTQARMEQLAGLFAKTWQRPPTATELKGLIDDYVKEEILYREALALGLDNDDTVIRRRLRQTDEELETYLESNMSKFELDSQIAFEQVFLNPERRGDQIEEDAASILEALNSNASADAANLGDATLLPLELDLTSATRIGQTFGPQFAKAVDQLTPGAWGGPIKSTFGTHLVRVNKREPGRVPALNEVRAAVKREWATEQRKKLEDKRFAELLKRYDVSIERQLNSTTSAEPKQ